MTLYREKGEGCLLVMEDEVVADGRKSRSEMERGRLVCVRD